MERKLAAEAGRPAPRFTPASTPAVTVPGVGAGAGAGSGGGPSGSLAGVVGGVGLDGMTLDMKTMCVCCLLDEGWWCAWEVCVVGAHSIGSSARLLLFVFGVPSAGHGLVGCGGT